MAHDNELIMQLLRERRDDAEQFLALGAACPQGTFYEQTRIRYARLNAEIARRLPSGEEGDLT